MGQPSEPAALGPAEAEWVRAVDWFVRPGPGRPETLNLAYNALDRHVIRGLAERPALVSSDQQVQTYAELLQQVAQLGGGLRELGVTPGLPVLVGLSWGVDAVVAGLACARLGAVAVPLRGVELDLEPDRRAGAPQAGATTPKTPVVALIEGTDKRSFDQTFPDAGRPVFTVVLRPEPGTLDVTGDVDFAALLRPGQFEPAVCAELPADAPWLADPWPGAPDRSARNVRRQAECLDLVADARAAGLGPGVSVAVKNPGGGAAWTAVLGPLMVGATVELRAG